MELAKDGATAQMTIDLNAQQVCVGNKTYPFNVDAFRKHCLLNGLDDIGLTMQRIDAVTAYESQRKQATPWLFN